jgi:hypothetical protein
MENIIARFRKDFPDITFEVGEACCWSGQKQLITYVSSDTSEALFGVLHELGHALLGHTNYASDIELLKKELAAWERAIVVAGTYNMQIPQEHIEDCLDTYRNWLHKRSVCPACQTKSLQTSARTYHCFNCNNTWCVTSARLCRPYRRTVRT